MKRRERTARRSLDPCKMVRSSLASFSVRGHPSSMMHFDPSPAEPSTIAACRMRCPSTKPCKYGVDSTRLGRKNAAGAARGHRSQSVQNIPDSGGLDKNDRIMHRFAGFFAGVSAFGGDTVRAGKPPWPAVQRTPGDLPVGFLLFHTDLVDPNVAPRGGQDSGCAALCAWGLRQAGVGHRYPIALRTGEQLSRAGQGMKGCVGLLLSRRLHAGSWLPSQTRPKGSS